MSTDEWKTWEGRVADGRFPLRQWVGGSEHSAVFLTERPGHPSEKAAIKLIPAEAADSDQTLARWRAAAQLSHPHLIRVFDGGRCELDGTPVLYLVTELAEEDLSQILPQRPLTPAEVADLLPPLLDALSHLHSKGLVHGRIKPSNVLATEDRLKLSADEIRSSSTTSTGQGRRDVYDAPETAAGIVSPAGDLWSVGVTLVAALLQKVPFADDEGPRDPGLPEAIPQPFRGIVRECLHLDPQRRCSIEDIQARLQPPGRSVAADREPAPMTKARTTGGRYESASSRSVGSELVGFGSVRHGSARFGWRVLLAVAVLVVFALGLRLFYKGAAQRPAPNEVSATTNAVKPEPSAPPPFTPAPARQPSAAHGDVIRRVVPEVSKSARDSITGKVRVTVRVEVDPFGKVTTARLTSPGPSKYFAKLALQAARGWEFSPPNVGGQAGESAWLLHFRFGRASTEVAPEPVRR